MMVLIQNLGHLETKVFLILFRKVLRPGFTCLDDVIFLIHGEIKSLLTWAHIFNLEHMCLFAE